MAKNQAIDGRQALVWYLEPETTKMSTGALKVGDVVIVKKTGTTDFKGAKVNAPYIVTKAIQNLTDGECIKCSSHFIGMATDKSVNKSKNTSDVTCDFDEMTNNITDGQVSTSGSITMMFSVDGKGYASTFIKQRFGAVDVYDANGQVEELSSATDEKDLLLFAWNARDAKVDDIVEFEVIPALITSLDHSSSYGSSQSMSINFTGNASDENGYEARVMQIPGGKAVINALATTRAEANTAAGQA